MITQREITTHETLTPVKAVIYEDSDTAAKAYILYFHGGGLLYGSARDLPLSHIRALTAAGFSIISYEYPLAPASRLDSIISSVSESVTHYIRHREMYTPSPLPFFLWGRSAGAYLCLITAGHSNLPEKPAGLISYYGYGFLCDSWFCSPSKYYGSLPAVSEDCLSDSAYVFHTEGSLETCYSLYVYARQTGKWKDLIYTGREKDFLLKYSLRTCDALPCPLFCAHSMEDPDVPYDEFLALSGKYHARRFLAPCREHDFDRNADSPVTMRLLRQTVDFLNSCM